MDGGAVRVLLVNPFYRTKRWQKLRSAVLRRDGYMDQMDIRNGERNEADTVHHIFPIDAYPEYRLASWNLISLTRGNHEAMHDRVSGGLSAAGRMLMEETARKRGLGISRLVLVCGLPGSGKTAYVRRHLGNGVAYDLDHIAAAFRLRGPHEEWHGVARRMANAMAVSFASEARRHGGTVYVIRTAPTLDAALAYDPDGIVICKGSYDISARKDRRSADVAGMEERLREIEDYATANGIDLTFA